MYQPITLKPLALAGDPARLPADFVGLTDAVLADFSASMSPPPVGYEGKGLWPLIVSTPAFDPAIEAVTGNIDLGSRTLDKATRTVAAVYLKKAIVFDQPALSAYASTAHAARRDGGVVVGGMTIKTDDESRGLITGAYNLSDAKPDAMIDFKAAGGWVTIDAATMQAVAIAVGSWVQACYTAWRRVDAAIAAGTITGPAQIDAAFAAVALPS